MVEALALLARPSVTGLPLAGGTALVFRLVGPNNEVEAVVDLSRLGLDLIERQGEMLRLGAMATLADVVENPLCCSKAGGLLSRAARMNATVNVRNVATVGGVVVAGDAMSELLLALLALDAEVVIQSHVNGLRSLPVGVFLRAPAGALASALLVEVRLSMPEGDVGAGFARVSRTPNDRPIVAAAAVLVREGDVAACVGLAMSGVAATPLRLSGIVEKMAGRPLTGSLLEEVLSGLAEQLEPVDDFRGSAEYRLAMAPIVARRALQEAWTRAETQVKLGGIWL
jgi:CO/xanthine dehydrogenase FAD-binding subunit